MLLDVVRAQLVTYKGDGIMSVPAMLLAALTSYTGASGEAFLIWAIVSACDLVFGVISALFLGKFKADLLFKWVFKIFVQLVTVIIFASLLRSFKLAADIELFFGTWILFFYVFIDVASIFDKMVLLGVMPRPVYVLFSYCRKRVAKAAATVVDDPALAQELEKSLRTSTVANVSPPSESPPH